MARMRRLKVQGEEAYYHVMSRTVGQEFYVGDIKQTFSRWYNKMNNWLGYYLGDRFKSVLVEKGEALILLYCSKKKEGIFKYLKGNYLTNEFDIFRWSRNWFQNFYKRDVFQV
jgi:hypothetical protein